MDINPKSIQNCKGRVKDVYLGWLIWYICNVINGGYTNKGNIC